MRGTLCAPVRELLLREGITEAAVLPFSVCRLLRPDKLSIFGLTADTAKSTLMLLVPYNPGNGLSAECARNCSLYAVGRDYHDYFKGFFSRVCASLSDAFPGYRFAGSADNAPIDERHAAALAGLGAFGDNGLLINETYGTYVFIGEILSDIEPEVLGEVSVCEIETCEHCGACGRACPMKHNPYGIGECLSAVTQTKRLEDKEHLDYIRYYSSVWGCDRCQSVCPHNKDVQETPVSYFREQLIPRLTSGRLDSMPDEEFSARAYAWRGRACIARNLAMIENDLSDGGIPEPVENEILSAMRDAGEIMNRAHDIEADASNIDEKPGSANFVTVYDVRVQNRLIETLSKILPDAQYLAEEKENDPSMLENGWCFIIDPIDGTTNFIHNYGISAISVGLLYRGNPVFGAVYDPARREMFHARRGIGAFLNGKPIRVSTRTGEKALYAVGTTPYYKDTMADGMFAMMRSLFMAGADIRRCGSAALDLCAVACGRADGFCELRLSPWDYAAGALLVTEAGGFICQPDGSPIVFSAPCGILAGTEETRETLVSAAKTALSR